jgi:hypothetical protein
MFGHEKLVADNESGTISLEDNILKYESANYGKFELPLEEIMLIGEHTTPNGPYIDDYFITFVARDGYVYDASCYAAGAYDTINGLSKYLNHKFGFCLNNSVDLASRILWPAPYEGQPLFTYTPHRPEGFFARMKSILLQTHTIELSPIAQNILHNI